MRNTTERLSGAPAGSEQDGPDDYHPTDEELGVGEDVATLTAEAAGEKVSPPTDDADAALRMAALLRDPAVAQLLTLMVDQRVAQLTAQNGGTAAPPVDFMAAMEKLGQTIALSINRSTAATVEQMPGHVKPVPIEVLEERAAAFTEMMALCQEAGERYLRLLDENDVLEAEKARPIYLLLEDFPAENTTFEQGDTMVWWGPPGFHMRPQSPIARKIYDAMAVYSGGEPMSAGEIGAEASRMRRPAMPGASAVPELPPLLSARKPREMPLRAGLIDAERQDLSPPNIVGTVVKVLKGGVGLKQRVLSEDMASY